MFAYPFIILLLFAGCQPEGADHPAANPAYHDLIIPAAPAPTLDGRIAEGEWAQALQQDLAGGGHLYLQHEGNYLYVAMRGVESGWGHVYVLEDDSLRVLHASAALGMAVYHQDDRKPSQLKREFVWEMRDPGMNPEVQEQRMDYLGKHGWVATTGHMGVPEEIEYQIDKRLLESASVLAVVYVATPEAPRYWPASLQDATLNADLIRGTPPDTQTFDPTGWQQVVFGE
ncbi:MAG TPA: hypothetical protein VKP65_21635 [Rhodothermales bacterium]|nr:hypothetical protein [Rhodothermales bacterium]